jgi:acetyl-CoA synthetase
MRPRHVAVVGGAAAAEVVRQCRRIGYTGKIWPVNPRRDSIEGVPCFPDVAALPEPPDAGFVAVPAAATVEVVAALARRGAGGVVCHASGFAEAGGAGRTLQRDLVAASGDLALIGPNCIGVLNYLDGVALWPDQHGGQRVDTGVAILSQSGNIGQNLTMHRRNLPVAYLATVGNGAGTGVAELMELLAGDDRITAIGLYLEGVGDVRALARAAAYAAARGVPVVAVKSGSSELGARANLSHTSSLATPDALADALFERVGIARVPDLDTLLETLRFLHVHGALPGARIASASCSGGEAALLADLAVPRGVAFPPFPDAVRDGLGAVLGDRVAVANPLDYHTYIWGDLDAQTACFTRMLSSGFDDHVLVLDVPRTDRCDPRHWETTLAAFEAAHRATGAPSSVVSSLPEGLPEALGDRLAAGGIAPMRGMTAYVAAVRAAARIGAAQRDPCADPAPLPGRAVDRTALRRLDEAASKAELRAAGVPVPDGRVVATPWEAADAAAVIGFPVVVKAVSAALAHKTEAGAVRLDLRTAEEVRAAAGELAGLGDAVLVEAMATDAVAELIVGVSMDARFGPALTLGSGGVLVELVRDAVTLLLPAGRAAVRDALGRLRVAELLAGFRGGPPGDLDAAVDAVAAIAAYACGNAGRLVELDVNPLLVRPRGVVAVDALIGFDDGEGAHE